MSATTKAVSDATFAAEVLQSSRPVLVDYWAEWCGPCKAIGPLVEKSAAEYADRLTVVKLNIDENPVTPTRYGVRGIPTLMLFKNGQPVATRVGVLNKGQLDVFLDAHTEDAGDVSGLHDLYAAEGRAGEGSQRGQK